MPPLPCMYCHKMFENVSQLNAHAPTCPSFLNPRPARKKPSGAKPPASGGSLQVENDFIKWKQRSRNTAAFSITTMDDIALGDLDDDGMTTLSRSSAQMMESIRNAIKVQIFQQSGLADEDRETCISYVLKVPIYGNLVAILYTHLKLCGDHANGTALPGVLAELDAVVESWQNRDNIEQWKYLMACLLKYGAMRDSLRKIYHKLPMGQSICDAHAEFTLKSPQMPSTDVIGIGASFADILSKREGARDFFDRRGEEAQVLLNLLQALLDSPAIEKPLKRGFMYALIKLSKKSGCYPDSFMLSELETIGRPIAGGGFGEVYRGEIGGRSVAVKVLRIYQKSAESDLLKSFSREAVVWRQLKHANILQFYGVFRQEDVDGGMPRYCLVSQWMGNGNLTEFLKSGRSSSVNLESLILDIGQGLEFLHVMRPTVVHGDLKGANILITDAKKACLADFGLAAAHDSRAVLTSTVNPHASGTEPWMAPELFEDADDHRSTTMTDVYAFACVCYEIYSEKFPFQGSRNIRGSVLSGRRPARPDNSRLDDAMWSFIETCWDQDPHKRLTAAQIVDYLKTRPGADKAQFENDADDADSFISSITYGVASHPFSFSPLDEDREA